MKGIKIIGSKLETGAIGFSVYGCVWATHAEALLDIEDGVGGEEEMFFAFIPLDLDDPGVNAFASVLGLATEVVGEKIGLEELLTQIFLAGRNSVTPV